MYLVGAPSSENIIQEEHKTQIESYLSKVGGIRDMLSRDRMKVAFFGRYEVNLVTFGIPK